MNNIEKIRQMEEEMSAHRAEMMKINRFFTVVYWICKCP